MIRPQTSADRLEEIALSIFLLICFLLAFLKDVFPVLDKGLTAALFAALFFTLRQIHELRADLREDSESSEIFFATNEEFYRSAREAVQRAKREICATYFRPAPPTVLTSQESKDYFEEVMKFARHKGTVRRIIGVSNSAMAHWCAEQQSRVASHPRYSIRVLRTDGQRVEPMSVALIDDETMYMAFSGPTDQQLGGIREDAPKLAQFHQNRFDQLWERGVNLEEFILSKDFAALTSR